MSERTLRMLRMAKMVEENDSIYNPELSTNERYECLDDESCTHVSDSVCTPNSLTKDIYECLVDESYSRASDSTRSNLSLQVPMQTNIQVTTDSTVYPQSNLNCDTYTSSENAGDDLDICETITKLPNRNDYERLNKSQDPNFDTTKTRVQTSNIFRLPQVPTENVCQNIDYRNKPFRCRFCDDDVTTRNFVRHLVRKHNIEEEVKNILTLPVKSKERKEALSSLRNDTNFGLYLNGTIRPKKKRFKDNDETIEYYPCIYCKAIYKKDFLFRHGKICKKNSTANNSSSTSKVNYSALSQTAVACNLDPTDTISKLDLKDQVFNNMRCDEISFVAKTDLLIAHYGQTYLKSQRRERKEYSCSYKIRELARLLIVYRTLVNNQKISFMDILKPENFDNIISATRTLSGYDPTNKTFVAPSMAMHIGTALKVISDELIHLILKRNEGFKCKSPEDSLKWRKDVKLFKQLVDARWNKEISSVANKFLNEKRWQKTLLVPLVNDLKIFREETINFAKICQANFINERDDSKTYKLLVECTLALLILFNRRRIGDVQYLKINDYITDRKIDFTDFEATLSESEKILTTKYKRVVNGGKGTRAVVILVPKLLQEFIKILFKNRDKYIPSDNQYVFAVPNSKLKWCQADVAIRKLTKKMKLQNEAAISSNRLRKHIATAMPVLSMSKEDSKQFSKFMGHTEKTHEEFYELPIDIYQTARVVKVLMMMENGVPSEFKGKSLSEIEIDINEYVEEDNTEILENENKSSKNLDTLQSLSQSLIPDEQESDKKYVSPKHVAKRKRTDWTDKEINDIKCYFNTFLERGNYPSSENMRKFIEDTKNKRSVAMIRSKIQHLIRTKNNK